MARFLILALTLGTLTLASTAWGTARAQTTPPPPDFPILPEIYLLDIAGIVDTFDWEIAAPTGLSAADLSKKFDKTFSYKRRKTDRYMFRFKANVDEVNAYVLAGIDLLAKQGGVLRLQYYGHLSDDNWEEHSASVKASLKF